VTSETEDI